jgi:hypothetical protein
MLCICMLLSAFGLDNDVHEMDVIQRLAGDMFGSCRYKIVPGSSFESDVGDGSNISNFIDPIIQVYMYPPTSEEVDRESMLPRTLTRANELFGTSPRAIRWGKITGEMWQIPHDHPRQNKQYCVDLAKEAGDAITTFYTNSSISDPSTFFLMRIRGQVAVHDMGIVAQPCGWIQPIQNCETMFKFIGRKWHQSCMSNLTTQGYKWDDMFKTTPLPMESRQNWDADKNGDQSEATLINSPTSHVCFPLEEIRPGKRQRAAGIEPYNLYKQVHRVKRVFVAASQWDYNYHHFIVDSLGKVIRHLDWLLANPDVFIHIRAFERLAKKDRYVIGGRLLRRKIFTLLGIDTRRVIYGNILADDVYMPRSSKCSEPLYHGHELRLLADRMKAAASVDHALDSKVSPDKAIDVGGFTLPLQSISSDIDDDTTGLMRRRVSRKVVAEVNKNDDFVDDDSQKGHAMPHYKHSANTTTHKKVKTLSRSSALHRPLMLIQHRRCSTEEDCAKTWREFSDTDIQRLVSAFQKNYGDNYRIAIVGDGNDKLTHCVACQIRLYEQADVLVGIHGAGLTNIMFMKPGAVLVELIGEFDGRMTPVCGYHGPLAAAFGIHHYLYFWEWKESGKKPPSDEALNELALQAYQFGLAVGAK